MPDDRNTVNEGGHYMRGEEGTDVEGHIRNPEAMNEDTRPSSPVEVADAGTEDDGPDVEGHGHFHHGHFHHGHFHHEPSDS